MGVEIVLALSLIAQRPPQAPPIPAGYYPIEPPRVRAVEYRTRAVPVVEFDEAYEVVPQPRARARAAEADCDCPRCRDARAGVNRCPCPDCEAARARYAAPARQAPRGWSNAPRRQQGYACGDPNCDCGCAQTGVCVCLPVPQGYETPLHRAPAYRTPYRDEPTPARTTTVQILPIAPITIQRSGGSGFLRPAQAPAIPLPYRRMPYAGNNDGC